MLQSSIVDIRGYSLLDHDRHMVSWMCITLNDQRNSTFRRLEQRIAVDIDNKSTRNTHKDTSDRYEPQLRSKRLSLPQTKKEIMEQNIS